MRRHFCWWAGDFQGRWFDAYFQKAKVLGQYGHQPPCQISPSLTITLFRREPIKVLTSRRHVSKGWEGIPYRVLSWQAIERSRGSRHGCPYGQKRDKRREGSLRSEPLLVFLILLKPLSRMILPEIVAVVQCDVVSSGWDPVERSLRTVQKTSLKAKGGGGGGVGPNGWGVFV